MANSFTESRDSRNIDKIREIEEELPQVVTEFMNDSRIRDLTTLSRLGYIRDLRTFFYFLPQKVRALRGVLPSEITVEQLGALQKTDFDMYPEYLDKYHEVLSALLSESWAHGSAMPQRSTPRSV